jgi:hypothetical protein
MPSFFSKFKKDGEGKAAGKNKKGQQAPIEAPPPRKLWTDAWTRSTVEPEEIQELLHGCTVELKSRGGCLIHGVCTLPSDPC